MESKKKEGEKQKRSWVPKTQEEKGNQNVETIKEGQSNIEKERDGNKINGGLGDSGGRLDFMCARNRLWKKG